MKRLDAAQARLLRFGVIDPAYEHRRLGDGPEGASDAEPDPFADYRSVDWAAFLEQDIAGALVMFDPTYRCNMRCPFCTLPVTSRTFADTAHIKTVLRSLALSGADTLVLTGGEPGIVRDFPDIVATAARLGLRVSVLTNGTWATKPDRVRRIVESGIDEIVFSLKGADRRTANRLSGGRFYNAQMRALTTLTEMRAGPLRRLVVNHVIAGDSLAGFIADEELDEKLAAATVLLALVEPYAPRMLSLVPSPEWLREALDRLLTRWRIRGISVQVEGIPLCLLGRHAELSRDAAHKGDRRPRILITPRGQTDHVLYYRGYQRGLQFTHVEPCRNCTARESCVGVHRKYASEWARGALSPLGATETLPREGAG